MKRTSLSRMVAPVVAVALLTLSPSVHAALVTYEFSAVIRTVNSEAGNADDDLAFMAGYGVEVGAVVTGTYTVDTDGVDVNPSSTTGRYFDNPVELAYRFGNLDVVIPAPEFGSRTLTIRDDGASHDAFLVAASIVPVQPGFITSVFDFILRDNSGSAFSSDGIPDELPPLSAFSPFMSDGLSTGLFSAFLLDGGGHVSVGSELLTHRLVVPLPTAFWLLGSGMLALTGLARRRRA